MSESLSKSSKLHIDPTHSKNNNSCDTSDKLSKSYTLHIDSNHDRNYNICDMSDSLSNSSKLHIDPTHSRNDNSCNTSAKFSRSSNLHIDPNHSRSGNSCQNSGKSSKSPLLTRYPPTLDNETWLKYDKEFENSNQDSWNNFKTGKVTPEQFVSDINSALESFLITKKDFQKESKDFFEHTPQKENQVEKMRKIKIDLNKKAKLANATKDDIAQAKEAVRAYSHILKVNKEKEKLSLQRQEEKAYTKNFWKTAKDITNGNFGEKDPVPTFSKAEANKFYKEKYEERVTIDLSDLSWFPKVDKPKIEYDLTPYKPKDIKNALRHKDLTSAPGVDGIVYSYLMKMPTLHKVLATAFTRIRDKGVAPECWGLSKVILIKKNPEEPDNDPTNFRMISLTLNMGKLYHTLEAHRTMQYMVKNKYLDPVAQKAYVDGVNGCVEHGFFQEV